MLVKENYKEIKILIPFNYCFCAKNIIPEIKRVENQYFH